MYVNYHRHSMFSNLTSPDSTLTLEDYVKRTLELKHETLCVLEHGHHGSMTNVLKGYELAQQNGLKLLIGAEVYAVENRYEKDKSNYHLVIMALNQNGFKALNRLISEANKTGFYYKARIDKALLETLNPHDVFLTTACVAGVGADEAWVKWLNDRFPYFALEVQAHNDPVQIKHNQQVVALSKAYRIPLIHGNDTHYITEEDRQKRELFLKGKGAKYGDESRFELDYPTKETIKARYQAQGVLTPLEVEQALNQTLLIQTLTQPFQFNKDIKLPTLYPNETHEQKMERLRALVREAFKTQYQWKIYDKPTLDRYFKAMVEELAIIDETKMEDYFLLNYEVIKRAKAKGGILTRTGRGSGVSFFVNKLLGFTEVDRLQEKVHLYPTRFMSASRILQTKSLPDIDHNLVDPLPFVEATREVLGDKGCYVMYSAGTMQLKEAFKNTCRAHDIDPQLANRLSDQLDELEHDEKWGVLIQEAKGLVNCIVSSSPNPCGYLITNQNIEEEFGVIKVGEEFCCLMDKNTADEWKYLKNDYLRVSVWDIISKVYARIGQPIDDIRSLREKTEGNEAVWDLYRKGLTATLNQASTEYAQPLIQLYAPQNVEELTAFVAGIRPSFASNMHNFLNRRPFSYQIPEFDKLLESSSNYVLYQENIMAVLVWVGFKEDETYSLIKAISKKNADKIKGIKQTFIDGFVRKTNSLENAMKVWQVIEDASEYSFNSSHALSVAYDSLFGAYLKATYPLDYYAVTLDLYRDDQAMTQRLMNELSSFNITLQDARFGKSGDGYLVDSAQRVIYKDVSALKYLNQTVAHDLFQLGQTPPNTCLELFQRLVETTTINQKQMKILIHLNFFEQYGTPKTLWTLWELFAKRYKKTHKPETKQKRLIELTEAFQIQPTVHYSLMEQIEHQLEYQGYLSLKNEKASPQLAILTSISEKYSRRWVTAYRLNSGELLRFKMAVSLIKEAELGVGSLVRLDALTQQPKMKQVNGKWEPQAETEWVLTKVTKLTIA